MEVALVIPAAARDTSSLLAGEKCRSAPVVPPSLHIVSLGDYRGKSHSSGWDGRLAGTVT